MPTPTINEFKKWARENKRLAEALTVAMANADLMRAKVDAYIEPIFHSFGFVYEGTMAEKLQKPIGQPITEKDFYLLHSDGVAPETAARVKEYYAACHREHLAQGYGYCVEEVGNCPALHAENLVTTAENALLESGCDLMKIERTRLYGESRKKMLDLLLRSCFADNEPTDVATKRILGRYFTKAA